jgi:hypothetical protein
VLPCLTPLSTRFQLYRGSQFLLVEETGGPRENHRPFASHPMRRGFAPSFVNYKKGCTRLAAASDQVYQLLARGRWFSPGTPASSITKTGRILVLMHKMQPAYKLSF